MSGTTPNEGFRYPLETDFTDVQDVYQLATGVDRRVRDFDAVFNAAVRPLAFVGRVTANGTGFTNGTDVMQIGATEWDTTGGLQTAGWSQPRNDPPSWWMLGMDLLVVVTAGTPTVGDHIEAVLSVDTVDPVSGLTSTVNIRNKHTESNSGGERIYAAGIVPIWHGFLSGVISLYGSATASKTYGAGSRMWGWRLGTVS